MMQQMASFSMVSADYLSADRAHIPFVFVRLHAVGWGMRNAADRTVHAVRLSYAAAEASEASEQSERAKLSGAFSGFPLLTHAFVGAPLLSLAFCCFASLHVVWHFLLNGTLAFPHSRSILFLVAPCLVLFSLVLPCANIS